MSSAASNGREQRRLSRLLAAPSREQRAQSRRAWLKRYGVSLRYVFYVMFHPFDGFWDLTHEHRGSVAAANTFIALFLVQRIAFLMGTSFQFINAPLQYINVFSQSLSMLLPVIFFCVANWGLTTLFEGKGTFRDIYTAMAYALVPYTLIQIALVFLSNILTFEEASFYTVLSGLSLVWSGFLILIGMMQIHDYSLGKMLLFTLITILAVLIIVFLLLVFLSLVNDFVVYCVSLYREVVFRLY